MNVKLPKPEEITNALQVIQNVCLSFESCSAMCPIFVNGCMLRRDLPPDQWKLNRTYINWCAFEEEF